jgi:hypothetical protein
MILSNWVALVGVAITLWSYVSYYRGMLSGRVSPHGFSWFVWGTLTATGAAAQIWGGGGWGASIMALTSLACFIVAVMSLRYGEKHIAPSDWVAFVGGLCAIPLWIITDSPLWSVVILAAADTVAYWPSIRKTWHNPENEGAMVFALASVKQTLALFAMQDLNFITGFYPAVLVAVNAAFVVMILWRRAIVNRTRIF